MVIESNDGSDRPATFNDYAVKTPHANPHRLTDLMRKHMVTAMLLGGTIDRGHGGLTATQALGIERAGYGTTKRAFWRDSRGCIKGGVISLTLNSRGMSLALRFHLKQRNQADEQ